MPKLRNFIVTDSVPCWVTWTYTVEAKDESDALARYCRGEYSDEGHGEPKIGDEISFIDNEPEAQDAGESETEDTDDDGEDPDERDPFTPPDGWMSKDGLVWDATTGTWNRSEKPWEGGPL